MSDSLAQELIWTVGEVSDGLDWLYQALQAAERNVDGLNALWLFRFSGEETIRKHTDVNPPYRVNFFTKALTEELGNILNALKGEPVFCCGIAGQHYLAVVFKLIKNVLPQVPVIDDTFQKWDAEKRANMWASARDALLHTGLKSSELELLQLHLTAERDKAIIRLEGGTKQVGADAESKPRLIVDVKTCQAVLDGKAYEVKPDCATFLKVLLDANGEYVSGPTFKEDHGISRAERTRDALPKPLFELIETRQWGYSIPTTKLV